MEILHISAECYPMAKAGGLGDVLGALPKYQQRAGHTVSVVIPMYRTPYLYQNEWELVFQGRQQIGSYAFPYSVIRQQHCPLGFDLYLVDIYGLLDRPNIYGYEDDPQRFLAFQLAVLDWIMQAAERPDIIHAHDHQAGLIPFLMQHAFPFRNRLHAIPSIFTIHNAQYQGWMDWQHLDWLPPHDEWKSGLIEWAGQINPLAAAVKSAWKVTTVSPSYLEELRHSANGMEKLFEYEQGKCSGILNGIDTEVWNPSTDTLLVRPYQASDLLPGKLANKEELCRQFGLNPDRPLITFIGRLVPEKAADLLPESIHQLMQHFGDRLSMILLGSGNPELESTLHQLSQQYRGRFGAYIGYYEALSHTLYAGADFLLMPSRVEPCGLNQLYALRYGTIPLVRNTGGLRDTVADMGDGQGIGICFDQSSVADIVYSVGRAIELYEQYPKRMHSMQERMMGIDHSWERSASTYLKLYQSTL